MAQRGIRINLLHADGARRAPLPIFLSNRRQAHRRVLFLPDRRWRSIRAIGRYRWFNDTIAGYFYLRIESPDRLVGGWWSASDATAEAMEQLPPVEGMVASTWIRQKDVQRFPEWAEAFFRNITPQQHSTR
jgi:hypothetical protein